MHQLLGTALVSLLLLPGALAQGGNDRILHVPGPATYLTYGDEDGSLELGFANDAVIFDNTCPSDAANCGAWTAVAIQSGEVLVSCGRLPEPNTPGLPGTATQYTVSGFEFGYATDQPTLDCIIRFVTYDPCSNPDYGVVPTETVVLTGLPGGGGTVQAFIVKVDLVGLGLPTILIDAEGDGHYDGVPTFDTFSYGFEVTNVSSPNTGLLVAGRAPDCAFGAGTCFPSAPSVGCPSGTGFGSIDALALVVNGIYTGCFDFAGTEYSSGYFEMYTADVCGPPPCNDACPRPCSTVQAGLFTVTGLSTNTPWSWAISSPELYLECLNVPGVAPAGSPALALATAFAASINGKGCPGVQSFPFPINATSAFLFVSAEGTQPFSLCVGPAPGPATTCCVTSGGTVCPFNPDLARVDLSGEDCNGNGSDDTLDIAFGASLDADQNGVPDECEPGTLACFGTGCPCGNDDPTAGCVNSTGSGALLTGFGSTSVGADDLVLTTTGCPPNNTGLYFLGGTTFSPVTVGDGLACTGGIFRYFPGTVDGAGVFVRATPVASAFPGAINPGDTRHFQSWTRDVLCGPPPSPCATPCGANSNLSNMYSVLFTP